MSDTGIVIVVVPPVPSGLSGEDRIVDWFDVYLAVVFAGHPFVFLLVDLQVGDESRLIAVRYDEVNLAFGYRELGDIAVYVRSVVVGTGDPSLGCLSGLDREFARSLPCRVPSRSDAGIQQIFGCHDVRIKFYVQSGGIRRDCFVLARRLCAKVESEKAACVLFADVCGRHVFHGGFRTFFFRPLALAFVGIVARRIHPKQARHA